MATRRRVNVQRSTPVLISFPHLGNTFGSTARPVAPRTPPSFMSLFPFLFQLDIWMMWPHPLTSTIYELWSWRRSTALDMNPRPRLYPVAHRNHRSFSRFISGKINFEDWLIQKLTDLSGYGWPFSLVFLGTTLLVICAVAKFATTLVTNMEFERITAKLGELCLTHLQVSPRFDCTAPFPHSQPTNISVAVDEANTRPSPVFTLQGIDASQIQLLAPVNLPDAIFSRNKSCFLFEGEKGYLHVKMESPVSNLTGILFDYSRFQRELDPVYHPREVSVWGMHRGSLPSEEVQEHLRSLTVNTVSRQGRGDTTYILIAKGLLNPMRGVCMSVNFPKLLQASSFEALVIQISSNWGGDHTCLSPFQLYVHDHRGSA